MNFLVKGYNRAKLYWKSLTVPIKATNLKSFDPLLCKFLQSKADVDKCTKFLQSYGFVSHGITAKDWDLAHIIPEIDEGNFLDMGSSDSYILKNLALKKIKGKLYGIDLREPDIPVKKVKYVVGDLMNTKLPDNYFQNITCLSVIEHEVNFSKFASEVARLLDCQGRIFITFDYWEPQVTSKVNLYGLKWQPLNREAVENLISECEKNGLYLLKDMDWKINEAVLHQGYYSPDPAVSYTFGMAVFKKQ
jgi:SAM-dependent methyltransferase